MGSTDMSSAVRCYRAVRRLPCPKESKREGPNPSFLLQWKTWGYVWHEGSVLQQVRRCGGPLIFGHDNFSWHCRRSFLTTHFYATSFSPDTNHDDGRSRYKAFLPLRLDVFANSGQLFPILPRPGGSDDRRGGSSKKRARQGGSADAHALR